MVHSLSTGCNCKTSTNYELNDFFKQASCDGLKRNVASQDKQKDKWILLHESHYIHFWLTAGCQHESIPAQSLMSNI